MSRVGGRKERSYGRDLGEKVRSKQERGWKGKGKGKGEEGRPDMKSGGRVLSENKAKKERKGRRRKQEKERREEEWSGA
jgi:hypothetical protein